MAYATPEDISKRLGRELDDSEAQIVEIRLEDAERLIRSRLPDLAGMVLDEEIDENDVAYVEAEAVLRLIRNQDGYSSEGDGNYNYMINAKVASGRLEILDEEWSLLGVRRGAYVIAPRVRMPWWHQHRTHPQRDFNPPYYDGLCHDYEHPAVWWGDESS